MASFEPDDVAEALAAVLGSVDAEVRELNARIASLAARTSEPGSPRDLVDELAWLRKVRLARVSQLLSEENAALHPG